MNASDLLVFAHIGDLHITKGKQQNYIDYLSILAQLQTECSEQLDFLFFPGDIADNGLPEQYQLVAPGLKMLSVPAHMIPGDHDMEQGNLDNFYRCLQAEMLPKSFSIKGVTCIFLDVCGPGKGGADFRLGDAQLNWLKDEVQKATGRIIIFMHTYPDDLVEGSEKTALNELIAKHNVLLVAMGHTHYNEIANDGHSLFTSTRSTGQVEEGPVGYSLITIDGNSVSWRFKALADPFPFVMITSPSDWRLTRDDRVICEEKFNINALVFGSRRINEVYYTCHSECTAMDYNEVAKRWSITTTMNTETPMKFCVEAFDDTGRPGQHSIDFSAVPVIDRPREKNGSDADAIDPWPENGIPGTQLGPNRNGKPSL